MSSSLLRGGGKEEEREGTKEGKEIEKTRKGELIGEKGTKRRKGKEETEKRKDWGH